MANEHTFFNSPKALLVGILLAGLGGLLSGCQPMTDQEAELPWSQPADWEYQQPGMPRQLGD